MNISLEVLNAVSSSQPEVPFDIGKNYLIRTISYHWLGRVASIAGKFVTLEDAAWIANTGRYSDALMGGIEKLSSSEIEPSPRPVILNSEHITDAVEYPFAIPRGAK